MGPLTYKAWETDHGDQKIIYQSNDKRITVTYDGYHKRYFLDGQLHRDGDKPAIEGEHLNIYYQFGKIHRDGDKPAYNNGPHRGYYLNGILHRETKGPAYHGGIDSKHYAYYGEKISSLTARKIQKQKKQHNVVSFNTISKKCRQELENISLTPNFSFENLFLLHIFKEEKLLLDLRIKTLERQLEIFRHLQENIVESVFSKTVQVKEEKISLNQIIEDYGFKERINNLSSRFDYQQDYTYQQAIKLLEEIYDYRNNFLNKVMEFISLPQYAVPTDNSLTELEPYTFSVTSGEVYNLLKTQHKQKVKYGLNSNNQRLEIQFLNQDNTIDKEKNVFYRAFSELLDDDNLKSIIETVQEHSQQLLALIEKIQENISLSNSETENILEEITQDFQTIISKKEDSQEEVQAYKQTLTQYL